MLKELFIKPYTTLFNVKKSWPTWLLMIGLWVLFVVMNWPWYMQVLIVVVVALIAGTIEAVITARKKIKKQMSMEGSEASSST